MWTVWSTPSSGVDKPNGKTNGVDKREHLSVFPSMAKVDASVDAGGEGETGDTPGPLLGTAAPSVAQRDAARTPLPRTGLEQFAEAAACGGQLLSRRACFAALRPLDTAVASSRLCGGVKRTAAKRCRLQDERPSSSRTRVRTSCPTGRTSS